MTADEFEAVSKRPESSQGEADCEDFSMEIGLNLEILVH